MTRRMVIAAACIVALGGCQTPGQRQPAGPQAATDISAQERTEPSPSGDTPTRGFSLQRVLQFAGFRKPDEQPPSLVPQEIVQLSEVVNAAATRASELNMNDPPEVTRQKAQSILDSLRPWESVLAAGRSVGLINDNSARILNGFAGQLRTQAETLVKHGANPETIAAIRQLAGNLQSTFNSVTAIYAEGRSAFQAIAGSAATAQP